MDPRVDLDMSGLPAKQRVGQGSFSFFWEGSRLWGESATWESSSSSTLTFYVSFPPLLLHWMAIQLFIFTSPPPLFFFSLLFSRLSQMFHLCLFVFFSYQSITTTSSLAKSDLVLRRFFSEQAGETNGEMRRASAYCALPTWYSIKPQALDHWRAGENHCFECLLLKLLLSCSLHVARSPPPLFFFTSSFLPPLFPLYSSRIFVNKFKFFFFFICYNRV